MSSLDDKLQDIARTLGRMEANQESLKTAVMGNGQPGLKQRVEDLEGSRKTLWGVGSTLVFLGGVAEWLFHRK